MDVAAPLGLGVKLLALGSASALVGILWRRRSEPTARPLLGVAVLLVVGATVPLGVADVVSGLLDPLAGTAGADQLRRFATYDVTAVAMGLWFWFTVQYTGRGGVGTTIAAGLVALVPAVVVGTTVLAVLAGQGGSAFVDTFAWTLTLTMTSVAFVGVFFVVAEAAGETALPFGGSLVLSAGAVVLSITPLVVSTFRDPTAVAVTLFVAGGLFVAAIARYPVFETLPAARIVGRDRVIDEMADAVVVVDRDATVRDLNRTAERVFEADRDVAVGGSLASLSSALPDPATIADGEEVQVRTGAGVALAVAATRVTDPRGRVAGHLLVCRDVTARRNRERRLSVLNQLLVGTVREEMGAVAEDAATVAGPGEHPDGSGPPASNPAAVGERIWTRTDDLVTLVDHAREIERVLSEPPDDREARTDVGEAVRAVATRLAEKDGVDVTVEGPTATTVAGIEAPLLRRIVRSLVEHHRTTTGDATPVVIRVEGEPTPTIRIRGDLEEPPETGDGTDTRVRMARLVVEYLGGTVAASTPEPGRRAVDVELPAVEAASGSPADDDTGAVGVPDGSPTGGGGKP